MSTGIHKLISLFLAAALAVSCALPAFAEESAVSLPDAAVWAEIATGETADPLPAPTEEPEPTEEPAATAAPAATPAPTAEPDITAAAPEPATAEQAQAALAAQVTAFAALPEDIARIELPGRVPVELVTDTFPAELEATLSDGRVLALPVSWQCANYENPASYFFIFYPVWDTDTYPLAADFSGDVPEIRAFLGDVSAVADGAYSLSGEQYEQNKRTIYNYLTQNMGMNTAAACGILGAMWWESGLDPTAYVACDVNGPSGGLMQWHDGPNLSRFTQLQNYCANNGYGDWTSLDGQLHFLDYETSSDSYCRWILNKVKSVANTADGAYEAGYTWCYYYGVPADRVPSSQKRGVTARDKYWSEFGSTTYTIVFNANGGSCSEGSRTRKAGETYGTLPTPTYTGAAFAGWYTAAEGGTRVTAGMTVPGSITLYAHWVGRHYTVRFNANGGSCATASKSVTFTESYGTLPTANRSGYTFAGWYTDPNGGTKVLAATKVTTAGIHTLYAHWKARTFTVSFYLNGGTGTAPSRTVTFDKIYGTLPRPTRTGYRFAGWYTALSGGTKILATTVKSSIKSETLYAHWNAINYIITFDVNGGEGSAPRMIMNYGNAYGNLPSLSRTGYVFGGWYTALTGGKKVTTATIFTGTANQTLYARWNAKRYVARLNANGGSCATASVTVTYGAKYGALPAATRTGYNFTGWFTKAVGGSKVPANALVQTAGVHTLYAHWAAKTFTVYFDANGGSCATASKTVTYGKTYGVLPTPTREGYTFAGWYTAAEGGRKLSSSTPAGRTANQRLYAHWTPDET